MSTVMREEGVHSEVAVMRIDTDVHLGPMPSLLMEYMPPDAVKRIGPDLRRHMPRAVFMQLSEGLRRDSWGPQGEVPGTHLDTAKRQIFGDAGIDFGIVTPLSGVGVDPFFNAAVMRGLNRWQADCVLEESDGRFLGSICVPVDNTPSALAEIEEWAGHPRFKQILIQPDGERPFGHPHYDQLWDAAARHELPVAVHFDESHRIPMGTTPVGYFTTFFEYHAINHPLVYMPHLVSWICSGVFSRHPNLRVAFLEGGFLWHRPVIARLAYQWKAKSAHLPGSTKDPIQCLHDNVRFSSQPIEGAPSPRDLAALLRASEADRLLMFATDYPHYDYDDPDMVLPATVDDEMRRRIMCETARELYDLPATRPASPFDGVREQ